MIEAIGIGFLLGEELDRLLIVDLDPGELERAVGVVEGEGLVEAEEILVEVAGFFDVVDVEGDVRDADDRRSLGLVGGAEREREGQQDYQRQRNGFHSCD